MATDSDAHWKEALQDLKNHNNDGVYIRLNPPLNTDIGSLSKSYLLLFS